MARELIEKTIDGKFYEFSQFNTTVALKVMARLTKILGEPLAIALGGATKDGKKALSLESDLSAELMGKAVRALIDRLDETEVVSLVKLLASEGVLCDHARIIFDDHFCGDIGHLFRVLVAAIEVQFGNFFAGIKDVISSSRETAAVVPPPPGM